VLPEAAVLLFDVSTPEFAFFELFWEVRYCPNIDFFDA
jgi:hypothetical protein